MWVFVGSVVRSLWKKRKFGKGAVTELLLTIVWSVMMDYSLTFKGDVNGTNNKT